MTHREKAPLRILLATYLANEQGLRHAWAKNVRRLRGNTFSDCFEFAFFHYDGNNSVYRGNDWYEHPSVRIKDLDPGCPPMFWQRLGADLAQRYDYIWLCDSDIDLAFFSWDLYRTILVRLQPMASQPSVVAGGKGKRSSMVEGLPMSAKSVGQELSLARENIRSEVMTPILSARVWPTVHRWLSQAAHNLHTSWFTDNMWDILAQASQWACRQAGVVVVDASPVRHMDSKTVLAKVKRKVKCVMGDPTHSNNRPLRREVVELAEQGLRGHCAGAGDLLLKRMMSRTPDDVKAQLNKATGGEKALRSWTFSSLQQWPVPGVKPPQEQRDASSVQCIA